MTLASRPKWLSLVQRVPLLAAAALIFVWPLAHVIALRNVLLYGLALWLLVGFIRRPESRRLPSGLGTATGILITFVCWLFVVALVLDPDTGRSLKEIKGEWLPALVAFGVGVGLISVTGSDTDARRTLFLLILSALLSLLGLQIAVATWSIISEGVLPEHFFSQVSSHKSYMTYVAAIAASLLLADAISGQKSRKLLNLRPTIWWIALSVILFAACLSRARNGVMVLLFIIILGSYVHFRQANSPLRTKLLRVAAGLGLCFAIGILVMVKLDDRWSRFFATVPVAWNIDGSDAWVDASVKPLPMGIDGLPVEQTAYERIAWARASMRFLAEHPLGIGVTRDAFGELMKAKYGGTRAAHSHSAYLDLGLSIGIPGLMLWAAFSILLLRRGCVAGMKHGQAAGLALLLVVSSFLVRSAIDSTLRDHILEQFMFFSGLLLAGSDCQESSASTPT